MLGQPVAQAHSAQADSQGLCPVPLTSGKKFTDAFSDWNYAKSCKFQLFLLTFVVPSTAFLEHDPISDNFDSPLALHRGSLEYPLRILVKKKHPEVALLAG